jgi:glycosyltransferase involved in cell wall biosynthesis
MDIKHTILMITYNQEDYIKETLDCLFRQGVLPYEVFIADDYSTDNTRKIILEYQDKYPEIIKPIFHEKNLGINQNLNYMIENVKVNGDIINFLAGDDLYKDNMLITFNEFIKDNNLSPRNEKFLLMSNQLHLLVDKREKEAINNFKLEGKNYLKLKLRNKIGNRYTGISRALYDTMQTWNLELGLWADALHSFDLYINCDKFYFINKSFPVYRLGSGVTTQKKKDILSKSWIQVANYILDNRREYLDSKDIIYLKKSIEKSKLELNNSVNNKISFLKYYLLSFGDVLTGYNSLKDYIFEFGILFPKNIKQLIKKLIGG